MILTLALYLSIALSVFAAPRVAGPVAGPSEFNVTGVESVGTGCPPGSISYQLDENKTQLSVHFNKLYVEAGPGIVASSNRRVCRVSFQYALTPGSTFYITSVNYQGYYKLDPKVTAYQGLVHYFQGQIVQTAVRSTLTGPLPAQQYAFHDSVDHSPTATCGIGSVLVTETDWRVNNTANPEGTGHIASLDSNVEPLLITYNLWWNTCK